MRLSSNAAVIGPRGDDLTGTAARTHIPAAPRCPHPTSGGRAHAVYGIGGAV